MKHRITTGCPSCHAIIVRAVPLCRDCRERLTHLDRRIAEKLRRYHDAALMDNTYAEDAAKWRGVALRLLRREIVEV